MSNVPVQKIADEKSLQAPWIDELKKFAEIIRCKAFELFESAGRPNGHDLDHWFEAERQLLSVHRTELVETKAEFKARVGVPGFDPKEIEVTALPDALLVKAQATREREERDGGLCYSEFSDQSLFRRIPLPQTINVATVTAKIEKGVLSIVASKAAAQEDNGKKISVAA